MPVIDEFTLALLWAAWLSLSTMPVGFMLGSSCSPCCGCGGGKEVTDPADEGTWVPSGTWRGVGGVTWTFTANPGDGSGETWYFYGSVATSKAGGGATTAEIRDWGNLCNWYSHKTTSPSDGSPLTTLTKRASRLPPSSATVHIFSSVNTTSVSGATVARAYFWGANLGIANPVSELTATALAHDSTGGVVWNGGQNVGKVNGGVTFNSSSNQATVNGGATFNVVFGNSTGGVVNGGAVFYDSSENFGVVNDGATFNNSSKTANTGTVNGGATYNDSSTNDGTINGGATFNDTSANTLNGVVNSGATFNDNSENKGGFLSGGTVNGGAIFNDAACSRRFVGNFLGIPCTRKFVAHPTDLPTCNGTANNGCINAADTCGCG